MRVVFSDESGINSELDSPNVVIAAVMLNLDSHWPILADDVEMIIRTQGHDPARYELKGSALINDLRKAKRHPTKKNLKFEQRAVMIWGGCLLKLFEHGVPVFVNAIEKAGYKYVQSQGNLFQGISPYMATFSQCLREADNYIHSDSPKEKLLWISDDAEIFESDLKDALRSIREVQQMNMAAAYPYLEFPEPRFSSITDTIYFGASKRSRALQLADLCATTAALHLQNEPLVKAFFAMLSPQIKNGVVAPLFKRIDTIKRPTK